MAQNINSVVLTGNMTADTELRHTSGGTAVCTIRIAVNSREKLPSGEWGDKADFLDVVCWAHTAEFAAQYLKKGSPVAVDGRIRTRTYEVNGQKRWATEIVARNVQSLRFDPSAGTGGRPPHPADDFGYDDPGPQQDDDDVPDGAGDFDASAQTAGYDDE
jgi:single-strand DNA-binding protein